MKKSSTSYFLSTGVVVEKSNRKGNRTGYTGAALSPSWTLDADKPFIAACGNPNDPTVMSQVNAQARTSLHLGHYADAREAAYVIGQYRKDPVATIRYVQSNGNWDKFPADLYDLPEGLAHELAIEILKTERAARKITGVVVKDTSVQAAGNLYDFFSRDVIVPIAKSMGGAEAFQNSLKGKSIAQFASEFGLVI
jgi:hypothetical protein